MEDWQNDFVSCAKPMGAVLAQSLCFVFDGQKLLVEMTDHGPQIPILGPSKKSFASIIEQGLYFGRQGAQNLYVIESQATEPPIAGQIFVPLRKLFAQFSDSAYALAGRALHLLEWHRSHRFCGACGTSTQAGEEEFVKICPQCQRQFFPRINPAIIVLIQRGDQVLLARSHLTPKPYYGLIAGFVEVGETLEQALKREVQEETGLTIKGVRFFGSEPWAYSHSLMIAFTAHYAGGELNIDTKELDTAAWFDRQHLPSHSGAISISGRMIHWFGQQTSMSD